MIAHRSIRQAVASIALAAAMHAVPNANAQPLADACTRSTRCSPSTALAAIHERLATVASSEQGAVMATFRGRINMRAREEDDRFALGEYYFLSLQPRFAAHMFQPFMSRSDWYGRHAWQRMMQIEFRAFERPERVETMLPEFAERFPYTADDLLGPSQQVANLAQAYAQVGQHGRAAELVAFHAGRAPFDAPYAIHGLPARFSGSFVAAGSTAQLRHLLISSRTELTLALERDRADPPASQPLRPVWREAMNGVIAGRTRNGVRTYLFAQLISQIDASLQTLPDALEPSC